MAEKFGPWGWTARYLGPKCLLDTSVLVPKCPDTSDPPEKCRSVSVPICPGSEVSGYQLFSSSTCSSQIGLTEIAGLDNGGPDIDGRIPLPSKVKQ